MNNQNNVEESVFLNLTPDIDLFHSNGEEVIGFEISTSSDEIRAVAKKELREDTETVNAAIKELRNLLKDDPELEVPLDNDYWLIRFLRRCKFYPESTYSLIRKYYSFKLKHRDIFHDLVPSKGINAFHEQLIMLLPNRDQLGRRILVVQLGRNWNVKKCSLDEVFKGIVIFAEVALYEPATQIAGAQVIFDMDGLSLSQALKFTPIFARRIVDWLQECIPLRLKGFHVVNQPYVFNMVFKLFKPFLNEKLKSRIYFHGNDQSSLLQHFTMESLPARYGGTLPDLSYITSRDWYNIIEQFNPEFSKLNSYGLKDCKNN